MLYFETGVTVDCPLTNPSLIAPMVQGRQSRLWYLNCLRHHHRAEHNEEQCGWVIFEEATSKEGAKGYAIVDEPHVGPSSDGGAARKAGEWHRNSLKILRLPCLVFGKHGDRDIESGKACQAAQDVERE